MTQEEIDKIKAIVLGPKQATSAAGSITDRDAIDLDRAVKLLKKLNDEEQRRASVERLGVYGRRYD